MELKTYFFISFLLLPYLATAQVDTVGHITTDGKKLAMADETPAFSHDKKDFKQADTPLLPINNKSSEKSRVHESLKNQEKVKSTKSFNPVPLIGAMEYYGKHNATMIHYCKSYLRNFGKGLVSVQNKTKKIKVIENILAKHHIPKELVYLAVIESKLNGNARSPVGAIGYWQFMSPTARRMGLVVNRHRDDRRNLRRSTNAAAKYLDYLYDWFDDWLLVVGAYNCGGGRMERAIKRAGGGQKSFWEVKKYLPKQTQNHVMAFVATATIMEKLSPYMESGLPKDFKWSSLKYNPTKKRSSKKANPATIYVKKFGIEEAQKMAIVRINRPISLEVLASVLKASSHQINRWNFNYYQFKNNFKPGKTYNLVIPKNKINLYLSKRGYIQRASQKFLNN